jgi:DNA-binding Lrp family transcriptional regulator
MDASDKKIIYYLLKDGRTPQRKIASSIGISAQALNYRMTKLMDDGILKRFVLRVHPNFYGKRNGFAAFIGDGKYTGDVVSKFHCLEKINLYEFDGQGLDEVESKIDSAVKVLGEPIMKYIPPSRNLGINVGDLDKSILEILRKDPRIKLSDIAQDLGVPYMTAKRRLDLMKSKGLASVVPLVDLSKGDIVIFSIFSRKFSILNPVLEDYSLFVISDEENGIFVCYSDNLSNAKGAINRVRDIDSEAEVMIIYEYEFYH